MAGEVTNNPASAGSSAGPGTLSTSISDQPLVALTIPTTVPTAESPPAVKLPSPQELQKIIADRKIKLPAEFLDEQGQIRSDKIAEARDFLIAEATTFAKSDVGAAARRFQTVAELFPKDKDIQKTAASFLKAWGDQQPSTKVGTEVKKKCYQDALTHLNRAFEKGKKDEELITLKFDTLWDLSEILIEGESFKEARPIIAELVQLGDEETINKWLDYLIKTPEPELLGEHKDPYSFVATNLAAAGREEEAEKICRQGAEAISDPEIAEALLHQAEEIREKLYPQQEYDKLMAGEEGGPDINANLDENGYLKPDKIDAAQARITEKVKEFSESPEAKLLRAGSKEYNNKLWSFLLGHTEFLLLPIAQRQSFLEARGFIFTDHEWDSTKTIKDPFRDLSLERYEVDILSTGEPVSFRKAVFLETAAETLEKAGKFQEAARTYDRVLKENPAAVMARYGVARSLKAWAEQDTKLDPKVKQVLYTRALANIEVVLKQSSNDWQVLQLKGDLLVAVGSPRQGRIILQKAVELFKAADSPGVNIGLKQIASFNDTPLGISLEHAMRAEGMALQEHRFTDEGIPPEILRDLLVAKGVTPEVVAKECGKDVSALRPEDYQNYALQHFDQFRAEFEESYGKLPIQDDGSLEPELKKQVEDYFETQQQQFHQLLTEHGLKEGTPQFAAALAKLEAQPNDLAASYKTLLDPKASKRDKVGAFFTAQAIVLQANAQQLGHLQKPEDVKKAFQTFQASAKAFKRAYALSGDTRFLRSSASSMYEAARLAGRLGEKDIANQLFLRGATILQWAGTANYGSNLFKDGQTLLLLVTGLTEAGHYQEALAYCADAKLAATSPELKEAATRTASYIKKKMETEAKLGEKFYAQKTDLEKKEAEGSLSDEDRVALNQIRQGLRILERINSLPLPLRASGEEPQRVTQVRADLIAALQSGDTAKYTAASKASARLLKDAESIQTADVLRKKAIFPQLPEYVQQYIQRTGDWTILSLDYTGRKLPDPGWTAEKLNKMPLLLAYREWLQKDPAKAKQIEQIIGYFQNPDIVPDLSEIKIAELERTLFATDSEGSLPVDPNTGTIYEANEIFAAWIQDGTDLDLATKPEAWVQHNIGDSTQNLKDLAGTLSALEDMQKNYTDTKAKLDAAKKTGDEAQIADLSQHLEKLEGQIHQVQTNLNQVLHAASSEFSKDLLQYADNVAKKNKGLKFSAVAYGAELSAAEKAMQDSLASLDPKQDPAQILSTLIAATKVFAKSQGVMLKSLVLTHTSNIKGFDTFDLDMSRVAGADYVSEEEMQLLLVDNKSWVEAQGKIDQQFGNLSNLDAQGIQKFLEASQTYLRATDEQMFKDAPTTLKEGIAAQIEQWTASRKAKQEQGKKVREYDELIHEYKEAQRAFDEGDIPRAMALFKVATDSRRQSRVMEDFKDFQEWQQTKAYILEAAIMTAAAAATAATMGALAPEAVAAAAAGTASIQVGIGVTLLEGAFFVASDKLIRETLYVGSEKLGFKGLGVEDPLKEIHGVGDLLWEVGKNAAMLKALKLVGEGYQVLTLRGGALARAGAEGILQDAAAVGTRRAVMREMIAAEEAQLTGAGKMAYHAGAFGTEVAGFHAWGNVAIGLDALYQRVAHGKKLEWKEISAALAQANTAESMEHGFWSLVGIKLGGLTSHPIMGRFTSKKQMHAAQKIKADVWLKTMSRFETRVGEAARVAREEGKPFELDDKMRAEAHRLMEMGQGVMAGAAQLEAGKKGVVLFTADEKQGWQEAHQWLGRWVDYSLQAKHERAYVARLEKKFKTNKNLRVQEYATHEGIGYEQVDAKTGKRMPVDKQTFDAYDRVAKTRGPEDIEKQKAKAALEEGFATGELKIEPAKGGRVSPGKGKVYNVVDAEGHILREATQQDRAAQVRAEKQAKTPAAQQQQVAKTAPAEPSAPPTSKTAEPPAPESKMAPDTVREAPKTVSDRPAAPRSEPVETTRDEAELDGAESAEPSTRAADTNRSSEELTRDYSRSSRATATDRAAPPTEHTPLSTEEPISSRAPDAMRGDALRVGMDDESPPTLRSAEVAAATAKFREAPASLSKNEQSILWVKFDGGEEVFHDRKLGFVRRNANHEIVGESNQREFDSYLKFLDARQEVAALSSEEEIPIIEEPLDAAAAADVAAAVAKNMVAGFNTMNGDSPVKSHLQLVAETPISQVAAVSEAGGAVSGKVLSTAARREQATASDISRDQVLPYEEQVSVLALVASAKLATEKGNQQPTAAAEPVEGLPTTYEARTARINDLLEEIAAGNPTQEQWSELFALAPHSEYESNFGGLGTKGPRNQEVQKLFETCLHWEELKASPKLRMEILQEIVRGRIIDVISARRAIPREALEAASSIAASQKIQEPPKIPIHLERAAAGLRLAGVKIGEAPVGQGGEFADLIEQVLHFGSANKTKREVTDAAKPFVLQLRDRTNSDVAKSFMSFLGALYRGAQPGGEASHVAMMDENVRQFAAEVWQLIPQAIEGGKINDFGPVYSQIYSLLDTYGFSPEGKVAEGLIKFLQEVHELARPEEGQLPTSNVEPGSTNEEPLPQYPLEGFDEAPPQPASAATDIAERITTAIQDVLGKTKGLSNIELMDESERIRTEAEQANKRGDLDEAEILLVQADALENAAIDREVEPLDRKQTAASLRAVDLPALEPANDVTPETPALQPKPITLGATVMKEVPPQGSSKQHPAGTRFIAVIVGDAESIGSIQYVYNDAGDVSHVEVMVREYSSEAEMIADVRREGGEVGVLRLSPRMAEQLTQGNRLREGGMYAFTPKTGPGTGGGGPAVKPDTFTPDGRFARLISGAFRLGQLRGRDAQRAFAAEVRDFNESLAEQISPEFAKTVFSFLNSASIAAKSLKRSPKEVVSFANATAGFIKEAIEIGLGGTGTYANLHAKVEKFLTDNGLSTRLGLGKKLMDLVSASHAGAVSTGEAQKNRLVPPPEIVQKFFDGMVEAQASIAQEPGVRDALVTYLERFDNAEDYQAVLGAIEDGRLVLTFSNGKIELRDVMEIREQAAEAGAIEDLSLSDIISKAATPAAPPPVPRFPQKEAFHPLSDAPLPVADETYQAARKMVEPFLLQEDQPPPRLAALYRLARSGELQHLARETLHQLATVRRDASAVAGVADKPTLAIPFAVSLEGKVEELGFLLKILEPALTQKPTSPIAGAKAQRVLQEAEVIQALLGRGNSLARKKSKLATPDTETRIPQWYANLRLEVLREGPHARGLIDEALHAVDYVSILTKGITELDEKIATAKTPNENRQLQAERQILLKTLDRALAPVRRWQETTQKIQDLDRLRTQFARSYAIDRVQRTLPKAQQPIRCPVPFTEVVLALLGDNYGALTQVYEGMITQTPQPLRENSVWFRVRSEHDQSALVDFVTADARKQGYRVDTLETGLLLQMTNPEGKVFYVRVDTPATEAAAVERAVAERAAAKQAAQVVSPEPKMSAPPTGRSTIRVGPNVDQNATVRPPGLQDTRRTVAPTARPAVQRVGNTASTVPPAPREAATVRPLRPMPTEAAAMIPPARSAYERALEKLQITDSSFMTDRNVAAEAEIESKLPIIDAVTRALHHYFPKAEGGRGFSSQSVGSLPELIFKAVMFDGLTREQAEAKVKILDGAFASLESRGVKEEQRNAFMQDFASKIFASEGQAYVDLKIAELEAKYFTDSQTPFAEASTKLLADLERYEKASAQERAKLDTEGFIATSVEQYQATQEDIARSMQEDKFPVMSMVLGRLQKMARMEGMDILSVRARPKEWQDIGPKLMRRGSKVMDTVTDVIAARIIQKSEKGGHPAASVEAIIAELEKHYTIVDKDPPERLTLGHPQRGYRARHLDIRVADDFGVEHIVEIQIQTQAIYEWGKIQHDVYKNKDAIRKGTPFAQEVESYFKACSDYLYAQESGGEVPPLPKTPHIPDHVKKPTQVKLREDFRAMSSLLLRFTPKDHEKTARPTVKVDTHPPIPKIPRAPRLPAEFDAYFTGEEDLAARANSNGMSLGGDQEEVSSVDTKKPTVPAKRDSSGWLPDGAAFMAGGPAVVLFTTLTEAGVDPKIVFLVAGAAALLTPAIAVARALAPLPPSVAPSPADLGPTPPRREVSPFRKLAAGMLTGGVATFAAIPEAQAAVRRSMGLAISAGDHALPWMGSLGHEASSLVHLGIAVGVGALGMAGWWPRSSGKEPVAQSGVLPKAGEVHTIVPYGNGRVFKVGRHPASDLSLPDAQVSKEHAQIYFTPDYGWVLVDGNEAAGSRNGIYINGARLTQKFTKIQEGDLLGVGGHQFRFRPSMVEAAPPPPPRRRSEPPQKVSFESEDVQGNRYLVNSHHAEDRMVGGRTTRFGFPVILRRVPNQPYVEITFEAASGFGEVKKDYITLRVHQDQVSEMRLHLTPQGTLSAQGQPSFRLTQDVGEPLAAHTNAPGKSPAASPGFRVGSSRGTDRGFLEIEVEGERFSVSHHRPGNTMMGSHQVGWVTSVMPDVGNPKMMWVKIEAAPALAPNAPREEFMLHLRAQEVDNLQIPLTASRSLDTRARPYQVILAEVPAPEKTGIHQALRPQAPQAPAAAPAAAPEAPGNLPQFFGGNNPREAKVPIKVREEKSVQSASGQTIGEAKLCAGGENGEYRMQYQDGSRASAMTSNAGRDHQEDGTYLGRFVLPNGTEVKIIAGADGAGGMGGGDVASSAFLQGIHAQAAVAIGEGRIPTADELFKSGMESVKKQKAEAGPRAHHATGAGSVVVIIGDTAMIASAGDAMVTLSRRLANGDYETLGYTHIDNYASNMLGNAISANTPNLYMVRGLRAGDRFNIASDGGWENTLGVDYKIQGSNVMRAAEGASRPSQATFAALNGFNAATSGNAGDAKLFHDIAMQNINGAGQRIKLGGRTLQLPEKADVDNIFAISYEHGENIGTVEVPVPSTYKALEPVANYSTPPQQQAPAAPAPRAPAVPIQASPPVTPGKVEGLSQVQGRWTYVLPAHLNEAFLGRNAFPDPDPLASSTHVKIYRNPAGLWLQDMGSRNGTVVVRNGQIIYNHKKHQEMGRPLLLKPGDQVVMGSTAVVIS